jgi:hypothetical protein
MTSHGDINCYHKIYKHIHYEKYVAMETTLPCKLVSSKQLINVQLCYNYFMEIRKK